MELLTENPYTTPPPYEKLVGNLQGFYSRRISIQHRLVYRVVDKEKVVSLVPTRYVGMQPQRAALNYKPQRGLYEFPRSTWELG